MLQKILNSANAIKTSLMAKEGRPAAPAPRDEGQPAQLSQSAIDKLLEHIEKRKSGDSSYDTIELDRNNQNVSFTATMQLSKADRDMLVAYFNEKMQYDGFATNKSGHMVLNFVRNRGIGSHRMLQQGVDEAMEALKDPKKILQTMNSAQTPLATALKKGDRKVVSQILDKEFSLAQKARAFEQAFNQGNIQMMEMLTAVGRFTPSPTLKNNQGVTLSQWLNDQARGGDDATRSMTAHIESRLDKALPAKVLAQVATIQNDISVWMNGMNTLSQSNTLVMPPPARSMGMAPEFC